jgi:tRNA(fMet)-specific endonuclease VapC
MVYALDTNIIIHYLRNDANVQHNFKNAVMQGASVVVPKLVDYELRRGFRIASAPKKEAAYKILTEHCTVAEMDVDSWERAIKVYVGLYKKRLTVGEIDILIAAFCLENGCTLVTNNTADFENIDGLKLVDWTYQQT